MPATIDRQHMGRQVDDLVTVDGKDDRVGERNLRLGDAAPKPCRTRAWLVPTRTRDLRTTIAAAAIQTNVTSATPIVVFKGSLTPKRYHDALEHRPP